MKRLGFIFIVFLSIASVVSAEETVQKSFCMSAVGFENVDDLKTAILAQAKRMAVAQLYGEMVSGMSEAEDFMLTKDKVMAYTAGMVRIQGNPVYKNGKNFGEVCVTISAYVTDQDKQKLAPVVITKKHCGSDPSMSTGQLKKHIMDQAVIRELVNYEPKLRDVEERDVLRLAHKLQYTQSGFIPDTETYCATFKGTIYPAEISALIHDAAGPVSAEPLVESLPDSAFSASSTWVNDYGGHGPANARFSDTKTMSNWSAGANNTSQWLQVDLGKKARIAGVATMARANTRYGAQRVTSYKLAYSLDSVSWKFVTKNGADQVLTGNNDDVTAVRHDFSKPLVARYIRFHPVTWQNHITMRVEIYGAYIQ